MQNSFGGSIGGPLNIPHIYHGGAKTFFFSNYNGKRGENPFDQFSTVPTLQERQGNFSGVLYTTGSAAGQPVQIFDPATNQPFAGNVIPGFTYANLPVVGTVRLLAGWLLPYIPCQICREIFRIFTT